MFDLQWTWLCIPHVVCAAALVVIGLVAAVVHGDRVMRLGVIGVATTALPWSLGSALAMCTRDPEIAVQLFRLGAGPVALIGPNLLLVLLGVSGQLERHRWAARLAGVVGAAMLVLCWATDWMVPGVQTLRSGVFYITAGPLSDLHAAQIGVWLAVGLVIAGRSMMRGERRRLKQVLAAGWLCIAIGGLDTLLVHGVLDIYPIAWLPTLVACGFAFYLELWTDLLRSRGLDHTVIWELIGHLLAAALVTAMVIALHGTAPVAIAALGSAIWMTVTGMMWGLARRRPPARRAGQRALDEFAAATTEMTEVTHAGITGGLAALWRSLGVELRTIERAALAPELTAWWVAHREPLAAADLATMRLGAIRGVLEAEVAARGATLVVPLIDRDALVGLALADHKVALRDDERELIAESARIAARGLTYVALARTAQREGATAREVELAEAMRRHAQALRDDELGPWTVEAAYRSAARTTGAMWSASLLRDDRLALLVVESRAHGVVAALATAALTGAFTAATSATARQPVVLDELLATLGASADGVSRGGAAISESIAAFVAILDARARTLAWACAGQPGGGVLAAGGAAMALAARGVAPFEPGSLLVIPSSGLRGDARRTSEAAWQDRVRAHVQSGTRSAALLVEAAAAGGPPTADLLAVAVQRRT